MGFVAAAIGGSALLGGLVQGSAAQNAASAASQAANSANNLQSSQFQTTQSENAPYRQAGISALSQLQDPKFQQGFTQADFHQDPGYQFALSQGQNALNAANAASGNSVSGAGLAALDQYNQGQANQEYQQAFNNFNQTQNQNYSRLSTLANLGQNATGQSTNAGTAYANNSAGNIMAAGSAGAQAAVGQANALTGTLTGAANAYGRYNAPAPANSGFQTLSQFDSSPSTSLQAPGGYLSGATN